MDWIVDAGLVVIELGLWEGDLSGVAETRSGPGLGLAIGAVGIGGDDARGASGAGNGALAVCVEPAGVVIGGSFEPEQGSSVPLPWT